MNTDADDFINTLKSLYFIDRTQLPQFSTPEWLSFRSNPGNYLIQASDEHVDLVLQATERHNNYGRDRPLTELLSDNPEEVIITTQQRTMLDRHHHMHIRKISTYTREMDRRDVFIVVGKDQNGYKTTCPSYSDTHTCKEVILLLNGAVIGYKRRNT
jgi:hypothetical protein